VTLADTQARFHALVTARDSVGAIAARDAGARGAVEAMVAGDARLSAVDRLDLYASMYFARLLDALRDDYARTAAVVGGEAFHGLITDYLLACPPAHPSLREAGARLPAFLSTVSAAAASAAHALARERPWLSELARLERARLEVFDAPDAAPVPAASLRAVAPERFGALRFGLVPAHRLLAGRFAVAEIWRAADPAAAPAPREAPETLIVWRRDGDVFHRAADADEVRWLPRLAAAGGVVFEDLCAALAETRSDQAAAARAFELCARWTAEGLLMLL
jgi:hypothetical protein